MSLHHEIAFEREICEHLGANGWLYEEGSAAAYHRSLALYPPDLIAWVQDTQPEAWEVLQKNHGAKAADTLLERVRRQLDQLGPLDLPSSWRSSSPPSGSTPPSRPATTPTACA